MNTQFDNLSDQLKQARNRLTEHRHGGLVLAGDELEATIAAFGEFVALAKQLETALDRSEWNRKATVDLSQLMNEQSAAVLDAMRSGDSKIVLFSARPGARPTPGATGKNS